MQPQKDTMISIPDELKERKVLTFKKEKYSSGNALECFAFVSAAKMKKEKYGNAEHLSFLHYEAKKKRLWATDGHRLHLCSIDMGDNDRHFKVISQKKGEIILEEAEGEFNLPKISSVLNDIRPIARHNIHISEDHPEKAYIQLMRLYEKNIIQQNFFNDLTIFSQDWKVILCAEDSAQAFKCENCMAVIMMMDIEK